jgi:hypothetical protein
MLITVKNHIVLSLPELVKQVLLWIYEPDKVSASDEAMMMQSFIHWTKKVDLFEHEKYVLGKIAMMLEKNERGGFEKRKELFEEHGIDWKKFHQLPEVAPTPAEYKRQLHKNLENDQRIVREIE